MGAPGLLRTADGGALHWASLSGHHDVVNYLLTCGLSHVSQPQPRKKATRRKRLTPLRERANLAGVLDRYKESPPGLRARAESGSISAKKELTAIHKRNHQVVDRAEVASMPCRLLHDQRLKANALSHRKRKLDKQFQANV